MKKLYIIFILFLINVNPVFGQNQMAKIKFEIKAPNLAPEEVVYITGNHEALGNWSPGVVQLNAGDNDIWNIEIQLPTNFKAEYKFSKGSWATEAATDNETIPLNYTLVVEHDTTLHYEINKWKDQIDFKVEGQITGDVVYHKKLEGAGLKSRDIIVWLPPDYKTNMNKKYPVLYMHDGQNLFDPKTSSFGVDWQIDETAQQLIKENKIKSIIIVGINNTPDRKAEYSPTEKGIAYMKFIVDVVKPFIDKNYRTLSNRENTAVGGSSMGGLISFMLAWYYPEVFSKAACMSPAFKYEDFDFTNAVKEYTGKKKNITLYIDNGSVDLDEELQPGVDKMIAILKSLGYKEDKDFYVVIDKDATHNEAAWAKRVWKPLTIFFGK